MPGHYKQCRRDLKGLTDRKFWRRDGTKIAEAEMGREAASSYFSRLFSYLVAKLVALSKEWRRVGLDE